MCFSIAWLCSLSSVSVAQYNMPARSSPDPTEFVMDPPCCHPQATISADLEQIMSKSRRNLSTLNFGSIAQEQHPQSEALSLTSTVSDEYRSQSYPRNLGILKQSSTTLLQTPNCTTQHSGFNTVLYPIFLSSTTSQIHCSNQISMLRRSLQHCLCINNITKSYFRFLVSTTILLYIQQQTRRNNHCIIKP